MPSQARRCAPVAREHRRSHRQMSGSLRLGRSECTAGSESPTIAIRTDRSQDRESKKPAWVCGLIRFQDGRLAPWLPEVATAFWSRDAAALSACKRSLKNRIIGFAIEHSGVPSGVKSLSLGSASIIGTCEHDDPNSQARQVGFLSSRRMTELA